MVELKSKVDELGDGEAVAFSVVDGVSNPGNLLGEAEDALVALGYKPVDASRAVAAVTADADAERRTDGSGNRSSGATGFARSGS